MRTLVTAAAALAVFAALTLASSASVAAPTLVADDATTYMACGRVYSDPHAYWAPPPAPIPPQTPGRSPFAKGVAACSATDFVTYGELVSGMEFMAGAGPTAGGGPGATVNEAPGGAQVTPGEHIAGIEFSNSRPLTEGSVGPVPVFFADDEFGCVWTTAVGSGIAEWIGLARRGLTAPPPGTDLCPGFQNKFDVATAAGADGLIVINFDDVPVVGTAAATIPGVMVGLSDGDRLKNSLVAGNPQQVKVTLCADGPCGASSGPAGLFPQFLEFQNLERDFGGNNGPCANSTNPADYCSVGLPQGGVSGTREKVELYMIRVTDERFPNANKKHFVFPLSIHGIERAGAEAGVRAAEDLATWAYCEARLTDQIPANGLTQCSLEAPIPHPLLETQPVTSMTAGDVLKQSVIYFVFPNPDGWRRGDPDNLFRFYQRYNGNGVDLNRDWPSLGYTFRPYTPWSEPETRSFGKVLKSIRPTWDGGIDLHGQLIDRAFSFTLLGASQRDFAKDQRILQTVKGAYVDAEERLKWSSLIKPNSAPPQCTDVDPGDPCDNRIYGVQWGTVWDTIAYQVTGALGDWIDSPLGLGADGIDNEMSLSHLSNCGTGACYLPEAEQLHVDGNKSLVYAMLNFTLLPEDTSFDVPGKVGYVVNPNRRVNAGSPTPGTPCAGLPPQAPILNQVLDQSNSFRVQFDIKGPADGVCNGAVVGIATPQGNLQGVGGQSTSSLVLERHTPIEPPLVNDPTACGQGGADNWEEVNRYYNQASTYLQAGQAVHGNFPNVDTWRICVTGSLATQLAANGAFVDLDITFSTELAWEDPGQLPYDVSNTDFFPELAPYMPPGQLVALSATDMLNGTVDLSQFRSIVLAENDLPGLTPAQAAAWGAKLLAYVQGGGNLVLTDGALLALQHMGVIPTGAGQITKVNFYAGYIAFTNDGGSTATYADPLARNVNQPGAAEGTGHRHQTYEPVPLGMDLGDRQDCSGSTCTAPVWTVNQTTWQSAGGRTVGQSTGGRASLGELPLGTGVVRIIGALLPMPTENCLAPYNVTRNCHPFGLADYALTYSGYQVLNNALQWGSPTAVGVARFRTQRTNRGVSLSWRTATEADIAGFNVWRLSGKTWRKVNKALVAAKHAGRARGASYRLLDRSVQRGRLYTYRLQVVDLKGKRTWHGAAPTAR